MEKHRHSVLSVRGLKKKFNEHLVLDDVSFDLVKGEILGIVGANGSGKSTLMNILFGNEVIMSTGGFDGSILLEGKEKKIKSSQEALNNGLAMVHQEFALFPNLSIAENIKVKKEHTLQFTDRFFPKHLSKLDKQRNHDDAKNILNKLGIEIETVSLVKDVSTNIKQFVEIAREIDREDLKVLILDEPTAVMNKADSDILLNALNQLANDGISIIFISHRLDEVKSICNKVMVLRDGKQVSSYEGDEIQIETLAQDMIGKSIDRVCRQSRITSNKVVLEFENYHVEHFGDEVKGINLSVLQGEILGITSLAGQGKLGIAKGIMDVAKTYGKVWYKNENILDIPYKNRIKKGIYALCEDRKNTSLLMHHSVKENIVFTANQIFNDFSHLSILKYLGLLDRKKTNEQVSDYMEQFDINVRSMDQPVWELSGGNQQKVCMARALCLKPEVLFISEPTRGIDIAAKEKILNGIKAINKVNKTTVIVASSELEELTRLCDRIVVLYEGQIMAVLGPSSKSEAFGYALSGIEGEYRGVS